MPGDNKFEDIIKEIVKDFNNEQEYFKNSDVKQLTIDILNEMDSLISNHVKKHFIEIGNFLINNLTVKENEDKK
jgi:uncharacterized protein YktB (UPF0637 family)